METVTVNFLGRMSVDEVRTRMKAFKPSYKKDWQRWIGLSESAELDSAPSAAHFAQVLRRWQAVRSSTKGRVVRLCRGDSASQGLCIEDLLAEAVPFVGELGDFTLRDAKAVTARQERALTFLWNIFRALPTIGQANAVGITKAVKLVTRGRIGPALDTVVRDNLDIEEPRTPEEWLSTLHAISDDLTRFEERHGGQLETLVEEHWQPIAVGRAYDMVAGPMGKIGT